MTDWSIQDAISERARDEAGKAIDEVAAAGGPAGDVAREVAARGGGTSEDDLRAYAEAAAGGGAAIACAALGAPALSPVCATVGGAIAGVVFNAIAGLFGGDDAMEAALAQSRNMAAAREVWRARMDDVRRAAWQPLRDYYAENHDLLNRLTTADGVMLRDAIGWWTGDPSTGMDEMRYAKHYMSTIAPAAAESLELAEQGWSLMWRPEGEVYSGANDAHERDRKRRITDAMGRLEAAAAAVAAAVAGQLAIWVTHVESQRAQVAGTRPEIQALPRGSGGGGGGAVAILGAVAVGAWLLRRR